MDRFLKFDDYLNESKKIDYVKKFKKEVEEVNKYIAKSNKDEIYAIEPDSTWESPYQFDLVEITPRKLIVKYTEDYTKPKKEEILFSKDADMDFEETKYMFSWIKKAIKKGYKEEGKTFKI